MLFFKACPKCKGDIYIDQDQYGSFLMCFQCGGLKDIQEKTPCLADTTPGNVESGSVLESTTLAAGSITRRSPRRRRATVL